MRVFRAYFNRKREFPQIWSIDEGSQDSEVNVREFFIAPGCMVHSRYDGTPVNDNSPSAWLEIHADEYFILTGVARFVVRPADGRP